MGGVGRVGRHGVRVGVGTRANCFRSRPRAVFAGLSLLPARRHSTQNRTTKQTKVAGPHRERRIDADAHSTGGHANNSKAANQRKQAKKRHIIISAPSPPKRSCSALAYIAAKSFEVHTWCGAGLCVVLCCVVSCALCCAAVSRFPCEWLLGSREQKQRRPNSQETRAQRPNRPETAPLHTPTQSSLNDLSIITQSNAPPASLCAAPKPRRRPPSRSAARGPPRPLRGRPPWVGGG